MYNPRLFNDVKETATVTLKYAKQSKQSVIDLVKCYIPVNFDTCKGINCNTEDAKANLITRSTMVLKDMHFKENNEIPDDEHARLGARYLLMPDRKFDKEARECDFNIFELQQIYPDVSCKVIAERIVDDNFCGTNLWIFGRYTRLYINKEVPLSYIDIRRTFQDEVVAKTLDSHDGIYTLYLEHYGSITGYKVGAKVLLMYFWDEKY
jgi:hypothetical protein